MAERFKAPVLKTVYASYVVIRRVPLDPPRIFGPGLQLLGKETFPQGVEFQQLIQGFDTRIAISEPSTFALLGIGLAGLAAGLIRRY